MSEGKGKGRASDPVNGSHEDNQAAEVPSQNSIFSRIKSSTAGLASSAFSAPSPDEINHGRVALLADSGKSSQAGTSSSSSWTETSRPTGQTVGSKESEPVRFRNGLEEQHVQQMESEFSSFLDGIDPFVPSQDHTFQSEQAGSHNHGVDLFAPTQDAFLRNSVGTMRLEPEDERQRTIHLTVKEQERLDGGDVLAILCSPSAMDDNPEDYPSPEQDNFNTYLTPEQISKIRTIANSFFPPVKPHITPTADHPLNLRPDLDASPVGTASQLPLGTDSNNLYAYFGHNNDTEEARRTFVQQWEGVLTGYVDEVWGDLLPLVKEARQEVKAIKEEDTPHVPPKALRRLGLILSHL